MGSVRGVWVIRSDTEEVLFSKRYPTVEFRFKRSVGHDYHKLPSDKDLLDEVLLKCSDSFDEFLPDRDSVKHPQQWPVTELPDSHLWPVVCLKKNNLVFVAAVPYEPTKGTRPPLVEIVGISAAIALLKGVSQVLGEGPDDLRPSSPLLTELSHFLCLSAPFGTPNDTNPSNVKLQLQFKKSSIIPKDKVPSWRPAVYKGPSKISLTIKEQIRAVQYDTNGVPNVIQLHGTVACKAELEGHPDVILSLTTPPGSTPLDHLIVHPCVQSADSDPPPPGGVASGPDGFHTRKIRFSAPLDTFDLCQYQCTPSVDTLPIRGFYQMKGDRVVELLIQLKLMETMKNSFEYCEVHMPFFNRGSIEKIDNIRPINANLTLSENKQKLVWNIGSKFPPKNLELSLGAAVTFVEFPPEDPLIAIGNQQQRTDEKFCVGHNSYFEIHFKINDYTISGCTIDHKAMTLLPQIKFKPSLVREVTTSCYKIWNSHGDVMGMPSVNDVADLTQSH